MEYGRCDEICANILQLKRLYYREAKALRRTMRDLRATQNLVPKARTKKELAERKADEEWLTTCRKEYQACGPEWLEQHAYRK